MRFQPEVAKRTSLRDLETAERISPRDLRPRSGSHPGTPDRLRRAHPSLASMLQVGGRGRRTEPCAHARRPRAAVQRRRAGRRFPPRRAARTGRRQTLPRALAPAAPACLRRHGGRDPPRQPAPRRRAGVPGDARRDRAAPSERLPRDVHPALRRDRRRASPTRSRAGARRASRSASSTTRGARRCRRLPRQCAAARRAHARVPPAPLLGPRREAFAG